METLWHWQLGYRLKWTEISGNLTMSTQSTGDSGDALFVSESSLLKPRERALKRNEELAALYKKAISGEGSLRIHPRGNRLQNPLKMEMKDGCGSRHP